MKNSLEYFYSLPKISGELPVQFKRMPPIGCDWAEFGVWMGSSAEFYLSQLPDNVYLYLFDSFEGLPEDWKFRDGTIFQPKGDYKLENPPTFTDPRVKVIVGWFRDTLPKFAREHKSPLALLHIDCDLYSSTKEVLVSMNKLVVPNTILIFDDFYNYGGEGWKEHSYKAFQEFVSENSRDYEYLARASRQAIIQITK